jgi:hypothetical protein
MANRKHQEKLDAGVTSWNKWRDEYPEIKPDLKGAILTNVDLTGANLSNVSLRGADLSRADLSKVDLRNADLKQADLSGATLADTLIDEFTNYQSIKGCKIGHNGFWPEGRDSIALISHYGPGHSVQGGNSEAIVESLKRARRLHGSSLTLSGIFLLIAILGLEEIKYQNVEISPVNFGLFAMPISIGFISLANSFIADALKGVRYLKGSTSVMLVGTFPWSLVKYAGRRWTDRVQSLLSRFIMSFHPLVYLHYWKWIEGNLYFLTIAFLIILSVVSTWTFILSQTFQKPIFFESIADN